MKTILKNGRLIDGTGREPIDGVDLVIEGSRLTSIGPGGAGVSAEDSAEVIDCTGMTIMPGMMDAHVHLFGARSMIPNDWLLEPPALMAARGAADCRKVLEAGFTAIRCAGSSIGPALKTAVDEGTIPGPKIVASNLAIGQTGGHGDFPSLPLEWVQGPSSHTRLADGADDCRRAAREQIRAGAGVIKILTSGGVLSEKTAPSQAQMTPGEVRAVVAEADRVGIKVMSHAHSAAGIKLAAENGVATIEHATFMDDEVIDLLLEKDVIVVPTFAILEATIENGREAGVPEYGLEKAKEVIGIHLESIVKARRAGVKIALGTDFIGPDLIPFGDNAVELEIMVDQVGMSPLEAIRSATSVAAEALDLDGETGVLKEGLAADLLVLDGDPLTDIGLLRDKRKILLVLKDGRIQVDRRARSSHIN